MARTLINVPPSSKRGDVIEIRALIQHPMETGYRPGSDGKTLPRDILRRFACRYDDGSSSFASRHLMGECERHCGVDWLLHQAQNLAHHRLCQHLETRRLRQVRA